MAVQTTPQEYRVTDPHALAVVAAGGGVPVFEVDTLTRAVKIAGRLRVNGAEVSGGGGSGTLTTIKEDDIQVGGADIVTLDFGTGFDVAESPDTEIQISLDLSEVAAGGELGGFLDAPTVDVVHSGSAHHTSFLQSDADLLYEALGDIAIHAAIVSAHHARYLDSEAIAAVEGEATLDLLGAVTIAGNLGLSSTSLLTWGGDTTLQRVGINQLETPNQLIIGPAGNVILRGSSSDVQVTGSGELVGGLSLFVVGDSVARLQIWSGGRLEWGPGNAVADVILERGDANRLDLATGDDFRLVSGDVELVTGKVLDIFAAFGDANPLARYAFDRISFGAGGASALDTIMRRSAAGIFELERATLDIFLQGKVTSEAARRWSIDQQDINFGDGIAAEDVNIGRAIVSGSLASVSLFSLNSGILAGAQQSDFVRDSSSLSNLAVRMFSVVAGVKEANARARYAHDRIEFGPGGASALDWALIRTSSAHATVGTSHKIVFEGTGIGTTKALFQVVGDTIPRLSIRADGQMDWGSGTGVADVTLTRLAAGVLGVLVADTFSTPTLLVDVINERSPGVGVDIDGVRMFDSFAEFTEIATPSNPVANDLRVYAVDEAGVTKLAILDSAGLETILGSGNKVFAFFMGG